VTKSPAAQLPIKGLEFIRQLPDGLHIFEGYALVFQLIQWNPALLVASPIPPGRRRWLIRKD
jgi:hypothetical protein